MNWDDPCPNCGHRRKRQMMSIDPNAPGLVKLWQGEGEPIMQWIAKIGSVVLASLLLLGIMLALHIRI